MSSLFLKIMNKLLYFISQKALLFILIILRGNLGTILNRITEFMFDLTNPVLQTLKHFKESFKIVSILYTLYY